MGLQTGKKKTAARRKALIMEKKGRPPVGPDLAKTRKTTGKPTQNCGIRRKLPRTDVDKNTPPYDEERDADDEGKTLRRFARWREE